MMIRDTCILEFYCILIVDTGGQFHRNRITNQRFWALSVITFCSTPTILVSLNTFIWYRDTNTIT